MEKFSVKKPFTILVAVIMVLLLGFVSITSLQTNLLPDISTPYLMVVTVYPGASPERVESEVSDVMENALGTVSGVENITATSAENYSLLLMKFAEGTDMNSAMVKTSNKVDQTASSLPSTCLTPSIIEYSLNMNAFMTVAVSREGSDVYDLSDFVNNTLSPYVGRTSGVSSVSANGLIEKMVQVQLSQSKIDVINEKLLETIRAYAVTDAVKSVTCAEPEVYNEKGETHIVLMHYGCKRNIVRCLVKRGCKVTVMPAFATAEEIKALAPDGIMLSNGPGDPAEPVEVIENLKHIFELNIPTFGICLGHQLSALAAGAKTMKLKYGHRGANQPVTDFESGRTFITSQNHGYAVVGDELPAEMGEVAQVNANDGTCEGIKYKKWNCFTVQFHPEANGGPKDTEFLFDRFLNNVKAAKKEAR